MCIWEHELTRKNQGRLLRKFSRVLTPHPNPLPIRCGEHSRFHSGIDLDLEVGDNVEASFDGIVKRADYVSGYGNLVVLKHFNGLETYYAHLSKILVTIGDTLEAGDKLGLGGSTGRSTGPHLHYEIRYFQHTAVVVPFEGLQVAVKCGGVAHGRSYVW